MINVARIPNIFIVRNAYYLRYFPKICFGHPVARFQDIDSLMVNKADWHSDVVLERVNVQIPEKY